MLTRKYHNMIADCISGSVALAKEIDSIDPNNFEGPTTRTELLELLIYKLSYEFKQDNPNFDVDRFRKACGL